MRMPITLAIALLCAPQGASLLANGRPQGAAGSQTALEQAETLFKRADGLLGERKYDEALAAARTSLDLRERNLPKDDPLVAASLNMVGSILLQKRSPAEAETPLSRALEIRRRVTSTDPDDLWESLNNLGTVYLALNRLPDAEPLLTEALAILEKQEASPNELAPAYNNLGGLLTQRGDYTRARERFRQAEKAWQPAFDQAQKNLAYAINNLGLVAQNLGDLEAARGYYTRALAMREALGENAELASTLNNLGSALQEEGRLGEAKPLYERAIRIYEKVAPASNAFGQVLNNLGVLYLLENDYTSAEPYYRRALAIRENALVPNHPDVATSLQALAIFFHNTGQVRQAFEAQSRAADIIEHNLALVLEVGSEAQKESYLQSLEDSVDVSLWMRSAEAKADAVADRAALLTVMRRKGRIQEVLAASTDALRRKSTGASQADLEELGRTRSQLASLELGSGAATSERRTRIAELNARADALEAKLSATSAAAARTAATVIVEDVQQSIPDGSVLVDFFRYRPFDPHATKAAARFGAPRYAAYALRRTGDATWVELGDAEPIDRNIESFRAALLNPRRTDVTARAAGLADRVTVPLLRLVGSATDVLVAPDGDLNLLPFQALTDDRGRFLIERYTFRYLTSSRDVLAKSHDTAPGPALIVSDPAFGQAAGGDRMVTRRFEPLPETGREAAAVSKLLPNAQQLRGANASEANLRSAHSPLVLHVATHGFFLSGSAVDAATGSRGIRSETSVPPSTIPPLLRSGLALAGANAATSESADDGILTASEAALLDLRGTELVFLSSCESGLGVVNAGESVYGLRRAFAIAGARSEVLTLWQVDDRATRTFVVDFYQRLARGIPRGAALREAQLAAAADPARRHPFFWAAFILSGGDGPLPRTRELVR